MPNRTGPTITFFDVDYTLFKTFANVIVVANNKTSKTLNSIEYNTYQKQPGESFDFSEFTNAHVFRHTSVPMKPIIAKANRLVGAMKRRDAFVIMTARSTFDNLDTFFDTFRDHGVNIGKAKFTFCGDYKISPTWMAKTTGARKHLTERPYAKARLFDDSKDNLTGFLGLQAEFPKTKFEAYFVDQQTETISQFK